MKQFLFGLLLFYIVIVSYLIGFSPAKSEASTDSLSYHEQLAQITGILLRIERKLK
jgi:hypothetical protein